MIVPMKLVTLLCLERDRTAAVDALAGLELMQLCKTALPSTQDVAALSAQLKFLARRSIQGDAEATFEFARRVELGIGTEPDPAEAAYWYEVAEEQGYTLPDDVITRLFL